MEKKEQNIKYCPYAHLLDSSQNKDDEVSLLEVWKILWKYRLLILGVTIVITAIAVVYGLWGSEKIETKVSIAPHTENIFIRDLLNAEIESIIPPPAKIFEIAGKKMQDRAVQTQFWEESKIVKLNNVGNKTHQANLSKKWFLENMSTKTNISKKGYLEMSVSLSGDNQETIVKLMNEFVSYVKDHTRHIVISNLKLKMEREKKSIENQIEKMRRMEEANKKRAILKLSEEKATSEKAEMVAMHNDLRMLKEQMVIAEKLNIYEFPSLLKDQHPYYARGVNALQAEIDLIQKKISEKIFTSPKVNTSQIKIEILNQRRNNDLFIEGLFVLQDQLAAIDKVDITNVEFPILRIVEWHSNNSPKSQLIVLFGLLFGFMMGVFAAFGVNYVSGRQ